MCADALRRIAKAGTEKPVEVRNIGKASLQCHVANTDVAFGLCCKERERMFQPYFGDVSGERCPRFLQKPLKIARRDAQTLCHLGHAEFRVREVRSDVVK